MAARWPASTAPSSARIVRAAQHYLLRLPVQPLCRFDVVALDDGQIQWVKAAFDAG
jgi:putative endonuclease